MAQIGDGHILLGAIRGAIESAVGPLGMDRSQATVLTEKVIQTVKNDPVVVNEINAEAPLQSRTTLGMIGALLAAIGALYAGLKANVLTPELITANVAVIVTSLYGLYGRWKSGLRPLNFLWLFGSKK